MKHLRIVMVFSLLVVAAGRPGHAEGAPLLHGDAHSHPSAAYRWADIILETTAREVDRTIARPTIISRQMAIAFTAMYDTSGYVPVNTPEKLTDPDRWQPIPFDDGKGGHIVLGFLTPHWGRVTPAVLARGDQFRPGPPPKVGSEKLKREVDACIAYNANLTLEQKSIVEFMRDGPRSTGQSGHWIRFAQDLSRRDRYDLDQDVKLFFCIANTAFDAFIACWDAKRVYDSSRPWTLVRYYYKGKEVVGWLGPGKGHYTLPAADWHPYSPFTFVTPPFPGYPSGHSTVSGACARLLTLFSGSDRFGFVARRNCCALTEAGYTPQAVEARTGGPPSNLPDTLDTELALPTFSATAEMAGISRVMGGYHIQADNVSGLALGRHVADYAWPRFQALFDGTATAR